MSKRKYLAPASGLIVAALLLGCSNDSDQSMPQSDTQSASSTVATAAQENAASADGGSIANRGNAAQNAAQGTAAVDPSKWWSALPRAAWADYKKIETVNPWFEVYLITDGIYAIYEPGQFEEVISFLIVGAHKSLLFDTGLGMGNIRSVAKSLTSNPITVLNSHGHYDHIGGNHQFDNIIARNTRFTRTQAKGIPHEKVGEYAKGDWIWKLHPPNFDPNNYAIKPYGFSRWIEENQFIDLGGVSLEVVFAPGHAPDGIVLIDHQRRLMFTGDTFYLAPLYAHLEGSSFDDYAATAAKLAALQDQVDLLLTSHNVPTADAGFLSKLDQAFQSIIDEKAAYETTGDGREYSFQGFSILTEDPPQADLFTPL